MFPVDADILILGAFVLVATLSSRLSAQVGLPLLVVFVGIGMLAGSEGPGGLAFTDYALAHAIGTAALILILFDGGLQTSVSALRRTAAPAGLLATVGVLLTALSVGLLAAYVMDIPLAYGLLLGSIVGSTDAAAVFAALRTSGLHLRPRLASTLEIESGSNDPMAVLATVACLEYLTGTMGGASSLAIFLGQQIVFGGLVGWGAGRGAVFLINRVRLPAAGLYPMLTLGAAFVSFGAAALLGGSGFLSVYVAGIVIGNNRVVFHRGVRLFHDGTAWLGQIAMFVVLGLLSFPSEVSRSWPDGLLVAFILMFVARPLSTMLCLLPFRYDWREIAFASWAGLKGAVPIILGIYPLLFAVDRASAIFHLVFFVVMLSASVQGWSLGLMARLLGVTAPAAPAPPVTVEVTSLQQVDADIVSYQVTPDARVAHRSLNQIGLPAEIVVALIVRDRELVVPKGTTVILPGDHVFVTHRPSSRWLLDHVFSPGHSPLLPEPLPGQTTLREIAARHGLSLPGDEATTLGRFLRERLDHPAERGDEVRIGMLRFTVLDIGDDGLPTDVRVDLVPLDEPAVPTAR